MARSTHETQHLKQLIIGLNIYNLQHQDNLYLQCLTNK